LYDSINYSEEKQIHGIKTIEKIIDEIKNILKMYNRVVKLIMMGVS